MRRSGHRIGTLAYTAVGKERVPHRCRAPLDVLNGAGEKVALFVMLAATALFAATWLAQLDGYKHDEVKTLAWILGVVAETVLAIGGNIGGANVFVYGIRVLKREGLPARQALDPRGVKAEKPRG